MAFWDASAIVPLCCHESSSARLRQLLRVHRGMTVWWGAPVEVRGALARLKYEGALTARASEEAVNRLNALRQSWDEVIPSEPLRHLAEEFTDRNRLRALDAFQLAAAFVWCHEYPRHSLFICLDARLRRAAEEVGFQVQG